MYVEYLVFLFVGLFYVFGSSRVFRMLGFRSELKPIINHICCWTIFFHDGFFTYINLKAGHGDIRDVCFRLHVKADLKESDEKGKK